MLTTQRAPGRLDTASIALCKGALALLMRPVGPRFCDPLCYERSHSLSYERRAADWQIPSECGALLCAPAGAAEQFESV